jgi:UDP:flavonoid glycosyltransferase YjiC (YdhE family)
MEAKKKVLFLIPPTSGHINPLICIANELLKRNLHVVFFGNEKHRVSIEKSGVEYRAYSNFDMESMIIDSNDTPLNFFKLLLDTSSNLLPELIKFCEEEQPDMIIYDQVSLHARYLINYLEIQQSKNKLNFKMPKHIFIFASFATIGDLYPNKDELKIMIGGFSFKMIVDFIKLNIKQSKLNRKHGINFPFDLPKITGPGSDINLCCVFHELQPRADNMIDQIKFVGCCIVEDVRNIEVKNEKLNSILNEFEIINPSYLNSLNKKHEKKLIYASLGTLFNNKVNLNEKIIDAFKILSQKNNKLEFLISVGKDNYELFKNKINNKLLSIPDNILILSSVPQIEILKRASLFITHAGMNSTSETIHYGVPVICLPLHADQPLVAIRICDELNFGKRLDTINFSPEQLSSSIIEVLNDQQYSNNILEFTKISRKYDGIQNAANIIINSIK